MKTNATRLKDIRRNWHLFDMKEKVLGRLATEIAQKLMGKSKPYFVPNLDCGDYVVVVNAKSTVVTGKKQEQKIYSSYSGYPGGLKKKSFKQLIDENPARIIREAISGMLPKNKLKRQMLKRLFIFSDENHPYKEKLKVISTVIPSAVEGSRPL